MENRRSSHRLISAGLLAGYLILFSIQALDNLGNDRVPTTDSEIYLKIAYNTVKSGAFSFHTERPESDYAPTAERPPAYPLFLALGIWASGDLRSMTQAEFVDPDKQPRLWPLKAMHFSLLLVTSLVCMRIVREVTGSSALSWLVLAVVGLDPSLHEICGSFLSENLAALLLAAHSLCLVLIVKERRPWTFALGGLTLALLTLTRPTFYYFWPAPIALFLALWRTGATARRRIVAGIGLFLLLFLLPVWAWMARNYHHFSRFYLSDGGGVVLKIRAELNKVSREEYLASFLYWSGSTYARTILLPSIFGEGVTSRLDRYEAGGIQQQALQERDRLKAAHGRTEADLIMIREARADILRHPLRHLLMSLPLAHRGIYVKRADLSLLLFSGLTLAFIMSLARRSLSTTAALLPALASFVMHSFVTHNIPRYSLPIVPILWVSLSILIVFLGEVTPTLGVPGCRGSRNEATRSAGRPSG